MNARRNFLAALAAAFTLADAQAVLTERMKQR